MQHPALVVQGDAEEGSFAEAADADVVTELLEAGGNDEDSFDAGDERVGGIEQVDGRAAGTELSLIVVRAGDDGRNAPFERDDVERAEAAGAEGGDEIVEVKGLAGSELVGGDRIAGAGGAPLRVKHDHPVHRRAPAVVELNLGLEVGTEATRGRTDDREDRLHLRRGLRQDGKGGDQNGGAWPLPDALVVTPLGGTLIFRPPSDRSVGIGVESSATVTFPPRIVSVPPSDTE